MSLWQHPLYGMRRNIKSSSHPISPHSIFLVSSHSSLAPGLSPVYVDNWSFASNGSGYSAEVNAIIRGQFWGQLVWKRSLDCLTNGYHSRNTTVVLLTLVLPIRPKFQETRQCTGVKFLKFQRWGKDITCLRYLRWSSCNFIHFS